MSLDACFFRIYTRICRLTFHSQIPIKFANLVSPFFGLVGLKAINGIQNIRLAPRLRHFYKIDFLCRVIDPADNLLNVRISCFALTHVAALQIQTPLAPIVNPKMNTGKEFPSACI